MPALIELIESQNKYLKQEEPMAETLKILIADDLAEEGIDILKTSNTFDIDYRKKTPREELLNEIGQYDGLIIRSASTVDKEVIDKATKLKVVIRAGVGVDNIDIPECSRKGIVVMNAPGGNSISTAEQAIALMFATARMTPQANASMHDKKWEKSKFKGSQLTGKTLGVIGLGRIGKEVVKRGKGLQMQVLGYDPFIPSQHLEHLQIKLVDVATIIAESDFITVHTPLTDTTRGLINKGNISKLKKGARLINCARGGIYDEEAVAEALKQGYIDSAGLDVFTQEPPPEDFSLYEYDNCILTPHLGASTDEAQIEVAKETAQEMVDYFKQGVARNSLNFPTLDPDEMDILAPWFSLCEKLGQFAAQAASGAIKSVEMEFQGDLIDLNLAPLEIAIAKGILTVAMGDEINLVNAPIFAKNRGLSFNIKKLDNTQKENNVVRIRCSTGEEELQIRATVSFSGGTIIGINNLPLEFAPEGHILYIHNKDVPKVVGQLGHILGEENINIASLQLSRKDKGGTALTVIQVDDDVTEKVMKELNAKDFIIQAKYIRIS